jgi:hypothetical protein
VADIEYSPAALDTLVRFHKVRHVIYVEGPEDMIFWSTLFSQGRLSNFKVKIAGGKGTLTKYAQSIINNNAMIVVAMDLDLADLDGTSLSHPRIIYTYGYSIENSLCSISNLANAISNLSCTDVDFSTELAEWFEKLTSTIDILIILDIANRIAKSGHSIPLHNAARFQSSKKKHILSKNEVQSEYKKINQHFSKQQLDEAINLLLQSGKNYNWRIRGHFLFSAVLLYIHFAVKKACGKKISLSNEALFAILVGQFNYSKMDSKDKTYLEKEINRLAAA